MNSRASYFNICATMVRENMRRFWPIPVTGFLIYFLSGVFPILMNYSNLKFLSGYIDMSLKNQQPFFMMAHLILPVTAAVLVFRYLHGSGSVSVMHAMPFTRPALFGSNVLSGLALCLSPVLLNGIILLIIAKPVYQKDYVYDDVTGTSTETIINVFSRLSVCSWIWESFIIILFIFAVAVFAGIVTGNSLMHFLTAFGFHFLVPLLYVTFLEYFSDYLFGFSYSGATMDFFLRLSPYLRVFSDGGNFSVLTSLIYIFAAAAVLAVSVLLYRRTELERSGDSLVFRFMEPVICYLITFFSMSLFGLYFSSLEDNDFYLYAGYVSGTVVGFLVGQMIVKKSVRIFNLKTLRRFGVYCAIAVLFFCCLNFDVTGYERRVPDGPQIASVTLDQDFLPDEGNTYLDSEGEKPAAERNTFREKENVLIVQWLHKQLLEDRDLLDTGDRNMSMSRINLSYRMKDGSRLTRTYHVPLALLRTYDNLAPLYESKEYRMTPYLASLPAEAFNYASVRNGSGDYEYESDTVRGTAAISNKEDIYGLAQALSKDLTSRTFDKMIRCSIPRCTLEFGYTVARPGYEGPKELPPADHDVPASPEMNGANVNAAANVVRVQSAHRQQRGADLSPTISRTVEFEIYPDYENTLAWMTEHGYGNLTRLSSESASFMIIERYEPSEADGEASPDLYPEEEIHTTDENVYNLKLSAGEIAVSDESHLVLTDKAEMDEILLLSETRALDYNDYYSVIVAFPAGGAPGSIRGSDEYYQYANYYINPKDVPDKIKAYFEK